MVFTRGMDFVTVGFFFLFFGKCFISVIFLSIPSFLGVFIRHGC